MKWTVMWLNGTSTCCQRASQAQAWWRIAVADRGGQMDMIHIDYGHT